MGETKNLAGLSQGYIDTLTEELNTAENCYKEYKKAAEQAKAEYDAAVEWQQNVKLCLNKIQDTYSMAKALGHYIETVGAHAEKVCTTVGLAGDATSILTEAAYCLSEQNEALKKATKNLWDLAESLNDPILNPGTSLMKCLNDFKTKVDEGIITTLEAVRKLLELMTCLLEMKFAICKEEDTPEGLIQDIERLKGLLACTYPHENVADPHCEEFTASFSLPEEHKCPECKDECGEVVVAEEVLLKCSRDSFKPAFCTRCGNDYLDGLKNKYKNASKQVCYTKCVWDYFKSMEQKAKSNKDATQAALNAAQAAKDRCKK